MDQYIIPKKLIHNHRKYRKYKSTLFYTTIQKETNNKTKLKMMIHEKPNCNTKKKKKKIPAGKNKEKETKLKLVV